MSVVRRCPNCGTTRATAGECEACHEAQVRYFCTNHSPGLWLDGPNCGQCGARPGEPARRAAPPTPVTRSPARPPTATPPSVSATPAAYPRTRSPRATPDEWRSREPAPAADEDRLAIGGSPMAMLQKMLRAAVLARSLPRTGELGRLRPRAGRGTLGCLLRLVVVLVLLFVAVVSAAFVFGLALFQGF